MIARYHVPCHGFGNGTWLDHNWFEARVRSVFAAAPSCSCILSFSFKLNSFILQFSVYCSPDITTGSTGQASVSSCFGSSASSSLRPVPSSRRLLALRWVSQSSSLAVAPLRRPSPSPSPSSVQPLHFWGRVAYLASCHGSCRALRPCASLHGRLDCRYGSTS